MGVEENLENWRNTKLKQISSSVPAPTLPQFLFWDLSPTSWRKVCSSEGSLLLPCSRSKRSLNFLGIAEQPFPQSMQVPFWWHPAKRPWIMTSVCSMDPSNTAEADCWSVWDASCFQSSAFLPFPWFWLLCSLDEWLVKTSTISMSYGHAICQGDLRVGGVFRCQTVK